MCYPETKHAQHIAEELRKSLFNISLEKAYAHSEALVEQDKMELYSSLEEWDKYHEADKRNKAYVLYWNILNQHEKEIADEIDNILCRYLPKYRVIWKMYFLERASIDDICKEVNYSKTNVSKVLRKLKDDMNYYYEDSNKENDNE